MAHAITPGVVIGFVTAGLSVMSLLFGGLIAGLGVAVLTAYLARNTILRSDASLASLYLIALAIGIFILSAAGSAVPLKSFLFGSFLGVDDSSMILVGGVATMTLVTFALILRPLIMSTCDPVFLNHRSNALGSLIRVYVPIGAEPFGVVQNIVNTDGGGTDDFARNCGKILVRNNNRATGPWIHFLTAQLLVGINALIRVARNAFRPSHRFGGRRNFCPIRSVWATGTARAV